MAVRLGWIETHSPDYFPLDVGSVDGVLDKESIYSSFAFLEGDLTLSKRSRIFEKSVSQNTF